jgi:ribosomal protection tetracycline resistance protein
MLTGGEGVLESEFDSYLAVRGPTPVRARIGPDPRNREEYLLRVVRRAGGDFTGVVSTGSTTG